MTGPLRPISDAERPAWLAFGRQLAEFRRAVGVSVAVLGAAAGLHPRSMERLEYGERRTRLGTIERLASALVECGSTLGVDDIVDALLCELEDYGEAPAPESKFPGHEARLARLAQRRQEKLEASEFFVRRHAEEVRREAARIAADRFLLAEAVRRRLAGDRLGRHE